MARLKVASAPTPDKVLERASLIVVAMTVPAGARQTGYRVPESEPPLSCAHARSDLQLSPPASEDNPNGPPGASHGKPADHGAEFEVLYETWVEHVARWVRALGGPQADREDLVQDVFLVAYRRLPDFDGRNPAGWLYRIARRRVRDFRRLRWFKHLVAGRAVLPEGMLPESLVHEGASPAENLERKQTGDLLERLLDDLNPEQRAAFVLFEVEGYAGHEIASLQGVPLNTVWARIHAARKKLKLRLDKAEGTTRKDRKT
jgi:RNA polymerase sigma-70 factor, ECF subfamily